MKFLVGGKPQDLITADFNSDGFPDVATANVFPDNVSVMLGDGAGGLAAPVFYDATSGTILTRLMAAAMGRSLAKFCATWTKAEPSAPTRLVAGTRTST